MSGVAISIEVDGDSPVLAILKNLSDFDQRKNELFDDIGSIVTEGIRSRWIGGEGLEGKWPLSIRVMRKGGTTLRDTSRLMNSVTHNVLPNGVEIGTNVVYGPIHHFGGVIKHEAGVRKTYFRQNLRTGEIGNRFVKRSRSNFMQESMGKAYSVNVPRRPWLGITEDEEQSILNSIEGVIFDE
ncbi:phage virion morphogenesis protein [Acinetobacter sp. WCHAc010052]|uniref:phage virion morphogenesis protein n=1 Tax=Acinetobacter sp. WCHAc010052 TaxID=2004647 RepID=UPI000B3C61DB|nr:phage virion morphogenesis protein [Acinetobacter sp. WCHAc010052]AXY60192.1 phage morphogenesis protein [Acinetobacter sp. WCHAc010052]